MKIFPNDGDDSLTAAAVAVVERLVSVPGPRSLCELQADEEDYQWLCNWASQLSYNQLRRWLEGISSRKIALQSCGLNLSYIEAAGCLLLLLASESARRKASEGKVWAAVRDQFAERASSVLFAQGQPRRLFKTAIEAAARKLDLRHVFGIEGTQNYYLSVYLQFGFTQKGMERLAHWLAGQPSTEAIMYLMGDRGQQMASQSFVRLWDALRNYRKNNITESQLRQTLAGNPWVLSDWTDELLRQARRHQELGTADQERGDRGEQAPPQFLENPRLQWSWPAAPEFSSAVVNLADFDLTAERYQIKSDAAMLTTLVAVDDGTYSSHTEEIVLPSRSPEFVASMVDGNGDIHASQLLELWDGNADVELFDLQTGKRLDAYGKHRTPSKEYGLLTSTDLEIEPSDLPFYNIGSGGYTKKLYLLSFASDHPVRVTLLGEEIWNSSVDGRVSSKLPEPDWAKTVMTKILPTDRIRLDRYGGSKVWISGLRGDTKLQYVRFGGKPLNFHLGDGGDYFTQEFDITREVAAWNSLTLPEVRVRLGLRQGSEQVSVERTNILNVSGILQASDDGWKVVNRQDKLTVNEARKIPYKVLLPGDGHDVDRLALLEGPIFLKRLWRHPRPLGQLGGYGAPLELRSPYNFTNFRMVISEEVRDPGIFEWVLGGDNRKIRFYLRYPIEPSPRHKVILWNFGKPLKALNVMGNVKQRDSEWDVSVPGDSFKNGFVALAYDGARIGSWWPHRPDWSGISSGDVALQTAALLKWMHAPIVSPDWLDNVQSFAQQYPVQTLSAWLLDEGLPSSLDHGATEEQWRAATRQVFSGWNPDSETARAIVSAFGGTSDDPVSETLFALSREDPLMMGRVAVAWLRSPNRPYSEGAKNKWDLIKHMRFLIAAVDPQSKQQSQEPYQVSEDLEALLLQDRQMMNKFTDAWLSSQAPTDVEGTGGNQLEQREEELLNQVSTLMNVDKNFVKQGIVQRVLASLDYNALETRDRYNAETALSTALFREYLSLLVLSSLLQEVE